jgi:hypothetical protein
MISLGFLRVTLCPLCSLWFKIWVYFVSLSAYFEIT